MTPIWNNANVEAAMKEGWFLADGSDGTLQVQRFDNAADASEWEAFTIPQLDSDDAACSIICIGVAMASPLHLHAFDCVEHAERIFIMSAAANV